MNSSFGLHKDTLASLIELGTLDNHFISNDLLYPNVDKPEKIIFSIREFNVFLLLDKYVITSLYCLSSSNSFAITPLFNLLVLLFITEKVISPLLTDKYNVLAFKVFCKSVLSKDKQ